jgi:Zn ribbon nucleic-acid-binding protein
MNPDDIDLSGVMRVMPENVSVLWPQLEPILKPAIAAAGTHTTEDVRRALMAMRAQLWVHMRKTSGWIISEDLKCPECKDGDLESHFSGKEGPFYACTACGWDEETQAKPSVVSAAVSEFVDYPAGLFVRVWLAGAVPDRKMDMEAFVETLDRWRVANGCVDFEFIGRHGWLRVFPWAKVAGLVMRGSP